MIVYNLFFDADDTLWDEQGMLQHFERTVETALDGLCGVETNFGQRFIALEQENIPHIGYGFPSYIFSFSEAIASNQSWYAHKGSLLKVIRSLLDQFTVEGPRLFPRVPETLAILKDRGYRLHLLTRGIDFEQRYKLHRSGLEGYFDKLFVVQSKEKATYEAAIQALGIEAGQSCMIGNSARSDVNPAIEVGMRAVWIPSKTTWEHDLAELNQSERVKVFDRFEDILTVFDGTKLW